MGEQETDAVGTMMKVNRKQNRWQQRYSRQEQTTVELDRYRPQQRKTGTDNCRARQEQMTAKVDRYRKPQR